MGVESRAFEMPAAAQLGLPSPGQTVSETIIHLKELNERLQAMEQEEDEEAVKELRSGLAPLKAGLVEAKWMLNRDRTVRLMTACCLAQLLRLYAPDPPFDGGCLGRVFALFVQQLRGLSEPSGTYYAHYFSLLESLATVKSVVLVWEVPEDAGRDGILEEMVKTTLALLHPKMGAGTRAYLMELLAAVLGECPPGLALPETMLSSLLEAVSEEFVGELIAGVPHAFGAAFAQHFNQVLLAHASQPSAEALRKVHQQASAVAGRSLEAVEGVLPQLAQELLLESTEMRTLAVQTLGAIFQKRGASSGPSQGAWQAWLNRSQDRVTGLRIQWIVLAAGLVSLVSPRAKEELAKCLAERLRDPEERVRERVMIALVQHVPNLTLLPRVLIDGVVERCLDKKEEVRLAALDLLAGLLSALDISSASSLELGARVQDWAFLPNALLKLVLQGGDDRACRLLFEYYLEHSFLQRIGDDGLLDERTHAMRWSWMWASLGEEGRSLMTHWLKSKAQFSKLLQAYLLLASSGGNERRLMALIPHLAERCRSPEKVQALLERLAKPEKDSIREKLSLAIDSTKTAKERSAVLRQLEQEGDAALLRFIAIRSGWFSVSRGLINELVTLGQTHESVPSLIALLMGELPGLAAADHGPVLLEAAVRSDMDPAAMRSLLHYLQAAPHPPEWDASFTKRLESICSSSDSSSSEPSRRQVKYAAHLLILKSSSAAASLTSSASSDTAHPEAQVKLYAWQILAVLASASPAILAPYLDELALEYEVLLSSLEKGLGEVLRAGTKCWLRLCLGPAAGLLSQSLRQDLNSAMLSALPLANSEVALILIRALAVLLGPACTLVDLLQRPALLPQADLSSKLVSKLAQHVAARKISPLHLLPLLLSPCKESLQRARAPLSQALLLWSRAAAANGTGEGETEHTIDTAALSVPEDLLVPFLVLLARPLGGDSATWLTLAKQALNALFDVLIPHSGSSSSTLSYLFALAVEVKRYSLAQHLHSSNLKERLLYSASELAQACLRTRASLAHIGLEAFPLPLRITDTAFQPLDPELAKRNLTKTFLSHPTTSVPTKKALKKEKEPASSASTPKRKNTRAAAKCVSDEEESDYMQDEEEETEAEVWEKWEAAENAGEPNATQSGKKKLRVAPAESADFSIDL